MSSNNDFEIENGVLVKYTGAGGDVVIPDGVVSIGEEAFYSSVSLTSITIPDGVTSIGDGAFKCCTSLISIIIPNSVTSIGMVRFLLDPEVKIPLGLKFQLAVKLIDWYDNAEAKAYVKKMLTKGVKMLIDNGNLQLIQVLLGKTDFVTKKNVDKYIQYAIDKKQQEIYLDLIRYKNAIMA